MQNYDFVSIGDIVTDAFIRLSANEADIHSDKKKNRKELCFSFGDKVPYDFVKVIPAVGNSTNASVTAARLGLRSANLTNQGDDEVGRANLDALEADGVSTELITSHKGMRSNYHYVLWYDADRTILIKHEAYPYTMPLGMKTRWVYLSSLGPTSEEFHDQISDYLDKNTETRLAFQPGTFEMDFGVTRLKRIYERSELFFCNKDEAQRILKNEEKNIKKLLIAIRELGPKKICITDGPNGAYALEDDNFWFIPIYPDPKPPLSRTGAGDAFSSTITAAIALGKSFEEALLWGPINSAYVVQQIGARVGLLHLDELKKLLAEAPEDYRLKKI